MASTALKSVLNQAASITTKIKATVVAELANPRRHHCNIPNYEDDRPLQLVLDETRYHSGLWTARITKDICSEAWRKAIPSDAGFVDMELPYRHEIIIADPLSTKDMLRTIEKLYAEKALTIAEEYKDEYQHRIREPLIEIIAHDVPRTPAFHP